MLLLLLLCFLRRVVRTSSGGIVIGMLSWWRWRWICISSRLRVVMGFVIRRWLSSGVLGWVIRGLSCRAVIIIGLRVIRVSRWWIVVMGLIVRLSGGRIWRWWVIGVVVVVAMMADDVAAPSRSVRQRLDLSVLTVLNETHVASGVVGKQVAAGVDGAAQDARLEIGNRHSTYARTFTNEVIKKLLSR